MFSMVHCIGVTMVQFGHWLPVVTDYTAAAVMAPSKCGTLLT